MSHTGSETVLVSGQMGTRSLSMTSKLEWGYSRPIDFIAAAHRLTIRTRLCGGGAEGAREGVAVSFDQDDLPRIEFKQNPLKMVVAQLRFPPEMVLFESEKMTAIQACLRARYPIALERQSTIEFQLVAAPGAQPQAPAPIVSDGPLRFADEGNEWIVSVATDSLSLETKAYRNGEEFKARWIELVSSFLTLVTPARVDRFGIRYVNQLGYKATSVEGWAAVLDEQLMGSITSPVVSPRVIRSSDQTWLSVGNDGGSIRRIFAIGPEGAEPASSVVLDFDLFSAEAFSFDIEEITTRFDRYHKWAWNLFRRSITDEMAGVLGEAEHE